MLELQIIEEIRNAWVNIGRATNKPEMVDAVPDPLDLKILLETIFLASVECEEGVQARVRVVLYPDTTLQTLFYHAPWIDAFPFGEELEFSTETLTKLAPAFDQDSTAIAVARNPQGQHVIVGALFYGKKITKLDQVQSFLGRPPALIMSVVSPGSIAIAYSDRVVGRFEKGQFVYANPGPMASDLFIGHIIAVISQQEEFKKHPDNYWNLYRDCLERLYSTAAIKGHGSTIIWLPSALLENASRFIQAGTKISSKFPGKMFAVNVLDRIAMGDDSHALADERRILAEFLDVLAQLSCVDGALIIDDELKPHRFRCHLAAEKWDGRVLEGTFRNAIPTSAIDSTRFGTRHNSAINFVGACPGAVAFVISEDGPVRVILKVGDDVIIWPNCQNTVFLD
jgi:hypothetical protein